jgi:hypothetical protein
LIALREARRDAQDTVKADADQDRLLTSDKVRKISDAQRTYGHSDEGARCEKAGLRRGQLEGLDDAWQDDAEHQKVYAVG